MLPFGIQPIHIIIVAVAALLIFGPARLPDIGRGLGRAITEFRKGAKEMTGTFMDEINQGNEPAGQTFEPGASQPGPVIRPAAMRAEATPGDQPGTGNFCIHCGKSNPNGAIYCNQCGAKVAE